MAMFRILALLGSAEAVLEARSHRGVLTEWHDAPQGP
jgi:hypothetical protein